MTRSSSNMFSTIIAQEYEILYYETVEYCPNNVKIDDFGNGYFALNCRLRPQYEAPMRVNFLKEEGLAICQRILPI